MLCDLDEAKGLDIGKEYRTDKCAAIFAEGIAEAERQRIRQTIENAISDGSTDSSYQEAEIVYVRHCTAGQINVNFSLVKNIPRGDADSISKVIIDGLKNMCPDYRNKLVGLRTDGANVILGKKTGAVKRIKEKIERPWLIAVHCSGHKLELAYKDVVVIFAQSVLFLLKQ